MAPKTVSRLVLIHASGRSGSVVKENPEMYFMQIQRKWVLVVFDPASDPATRAEQDKLLEITIERRLRSVFHE